MVAPTLYPPADARTQWFGERFPGADMGGVDKVLLHTTEGSSWPPYAGGSEAPNLTYDPRSHRWRQHFKLNRSARALRDDTATAVRENRDRVCQVEIIAVCDPSVYRRSSRLLPANELDDDALADLGAFLAFMHAFFRVPLVAAPKWLPYPRSAGSSPVRMTGRSYDAFRGVLGHMHVSGNAHGDPGNLDVPRIIRAANRAARPTGSAPVIAAPPVAPVVPTTKPTTLIVPKGSTMYRLLKTSDGRYWGVSGLQCTHLENRPIIEAFCEMTGLALADAKPTTYDLLENFQRIT